MDSHHNENSILDKVAEIAAKSIERRLEKRAVALLDASKSKDNGDDAMRRGNLLDATRWHRHSLQLMETAASAACEALEIAQDFGIEPPDELTGAGWELPTEHRGVGEGDDGLDAEIRDIENLKCGELSRVTPPVYCR